MNSYAEAGLRILEQMLARTHLSRPADAGTVLAEVLENELDASGVVVYLVNLEQTALMPLARAGGETTRSQDIDGSMAGRAFASSKVLTGHADEAGHSRVYVPLLDGTDRVGVLQADLAVPEAADLPKDLMLVLERFGHAAAQMLIAKRMYGDPLHLAQRTRPVEVGAELLSAVLPPSTFATEGLVISAMVQPAYENGGDAFDYAVNEDAIHLAVFDAVGHGLHAAQLSTFTVAAYRASRRAGQDLATTYAALDAAVGDQFNAEAFTTAILAELDPSTGILRWINAGHPPPLVLRHNRVVRELRDVRATPLGMPMFATEPDVASERLEPGDIVVLYTDGVVEARRSSGEQLGVEGLSEFLQREAAAQQNPPETLRRLQRSLAADGELRLRDDATVLVAHWQRGAERNLLPQTV
jgi:serine phosphatase RsbU (regulator of sigma subunit)